MTMRFNRTTKSSNGPAWKKSSTTHHHQHHLFKSTSNFMENLPENIRLGDIWESYQNKTFFSSKIARFKENGWYCKE